MVMMSPQLLDMGDQIWLEDGEIAVGDVPATLSLPLVLKSESCGQSPRETKCNRALLGLSSRGVLEGRALLTTHALLFHTQEEPPRNESTLLRIPYLNLREMTPRGRSLALRFRQLIQIDLKLIDGRYRCTRNHTRISLNEPDAALKPRDDQEGFDHGASSLCLVRIGDSSQWKSNEATDLCIEFFKRWKEGNESSLQSMAFEVLQALTSKKIPTSVQSYACVHCFHQIKLESRPCLLYIIPGEGLILVQLPYGRVLNIQYRRCLFAFTRSDGNRTTSVEVFHAQTETTAAPTSRRLHSLYLSCTNVEDANTIITSMSNAEPRIFSPQRDPTFLKHMTELWQAGRLSNYHYLDFLNCLGGRSRDALSKYPVYPWIVSDFSLFELDLDAATETVRRPARCSTSFRDLAKPIGALSQDRLEVLLERMHYLPRGEQYLYGSHYSTPSFTAHWLLRKEPELHLRLNQGKFDHHSRLFNSIEETWLAVLKGQTSFMELIPAFFENDSSLLLSKLEIAAANLLLTAVKLPAQCRFPALGKFEPPCVKGMSRCELDALWFLFLHRCALESDNVSKRLHKWIDLVFGFRQTGEPAREAFNLFHPSSYLNTINDSRTEEAPIDVAMLKRMQEFGQVPCQLFTKPHPLRRTNLANLLYNGEDGSTMTFKELASQFLSFLDDSPHKPSPMSLSSCSWVTVLQQNPRLLPSAQVTRQIDASLRSADCFLSRVKAETSRDRLVAWSGFASAEVLTEAVTISLPTALLAVHDSRVAALDEDRTALSIHALENLVSLGSSVTPGNESDSKRLLPYNSIVLPSRVSSLDFSGGGSILVCGGEDGCIITNSISEDFIRPRQMVYPDAHRGRVLCVASDPFSSSSFLTGGEDQCVAHWDCETQKLLARFETHEAPVVACSIFSCFSASASADGEIAVRDMRIPPWSRPVMSRSLSSPWSVRSMQIIGPKSGKTLSLQCIVDQQSRPAEIFRPFSNTLQTLWRQLDDLCPQHGRTIFERPESPSPRPAALAYVNFELMLDDASSARTCISLTKDSPGPYAATAALTCLGDYKITTASVEGTPLILAGGTRIDGQQPALCVIDTVNDRLRHTAKLSSAPDWLGIYPTTVMTPHSGSLAHSAMNASFANSCPYIIAKGQQGRVTILV